MNDTLATIGLHEIAWEDQTFAVRNFEPCDLLEASLLRHGILFPPWVWAGEGGMYTIVDGFKRFSWARENGIESVECIVFPEESSPQRLLVQRMEGKLFGPSLNPAEKAQIIAKLAACIPQEELMREFLPVMKVSPKPEAIEGWRRLGRADEELLGALALEEIFERTALELVGWEEDASRAALAILRGLRCSASIQMEVLERITEIALRQGAQRTEILCDPKFREILDDSRLNHRQKTQAIRDLLARWRFPRLREREERFARELTSASLPVNIRLLPPRAFEGERWQLQISFSHPEELQHLLEEAGIFARSPNLKTLMKPTTD